MVAGLSDKSITEAFYQRLANLYARDGDGWAPLPQWARFYLELGTIAGLRPVDNARLVMALAVPSRAYVAAFCCWLRFGSCSASLRPQRYQGPAYSQNGAVGSGQPRYGLRG